jgi:hypothetical protein
MLRFILAPFQTKKNYTPHSATVVSSATSVIKYVPYNGRILCARVPQPKALSRTVHTPMLGLLKEISRCYLVLHQIL